MSGHKGHHHGFHPFGGRISKHFSESLSPEAPYLSYYDTRLSQADYDSIKHDNWLTDNAIEFWEEYLDQEILKGHKNARVILLRPPITHALRNQNQEDIKAHPDIFREMFPSFKGATHIFLPINDYTGDEGSQIQQFNSNKGTPRASSDFTSNGMHWTLLVVSVVDGVAFHYDSVRGHNSSHAKLATLRLSWLLGRPADHPLRLLDLDDAPQQCNGSDCGVYVCMIMKYLLQNRLLQQDANGQVSMSMKGREIDAEKGRKDMMRLIEEFRREGIRRASDSRSRSPFGRHSTSTSPPRVAD